MQDWHTRPQLPVADSKEVPDVRRCIRRQLGCVVSTDGTATHEQGQVEKGSKLAALEAGLGRQRLGELLHGDMGGGAGAHDGVKSLHGLVGDFLPLGQRGHDIASSSAGPSKRQQRRDVQVSQGLLQDFQRKNVEVL